MGRMYLYVHYGSALVKSNEANISIASSAVLYGLSVYTVFPVSKNNAGELVAFRLRDHYERLCNSAKILAIDTFPNDLTYTAFEEYVRKLVKKIKLRKMYTFEPQYM